MKHKKQIEILETFVSKQVNPNIQDENGKTPIHLLCDIPFFEEFNLKRLNLLAEGEIKIQPNITDKTGKTALHYAAINNNKLLYDRLIELGADPKIQDKLEKNPCG